jgi:hypothetical protein
VPELIAEIEGGEKEGVVLEAHGFDGGGAAGIRNSGWDALDKRG